MPSTVQPTQRLAPSRTHFLARLSRRLGHLVPVPDRETSVLDRREAPEQMRSFLVKAAGGPRRLLFNDRLGLSMMDHDGGRSPRSKEGGAIKGYRKGRGKETKVLTWLALIPTLRLSNRIILRC